MVQVWYMFAQHVPYFKPFVHRHLRPIMVQGYMISVLCTILPVVVPVVALAATGIVIAATVAET